MTHDEVEAMSQPIEDRAKADGDGMVLYYLPRGDTNMFTLGGGISGVEAIQICHHLRVKMRVPLNVLIDHLTILEAAEEEAGEEQP